MNRRLMVLLVLIVTRRAGRCALVDFHASNLHIGTELDPDEELARRDEPTVYRTVLS